MSRERRSAPGAAGATNPWLIAVLVALAAFMEVLDTTIANVALPHIAGGLAVSEDEASWVVTTYLVANAIILTASSFLANLCGRKRFFLICLALFTVELGDVRAVAGICNRCCCSGSLQGLGGGGMVPRGAIDPGRLVSRRQSAARPLRFRYRGRRGAGGRAVARRLAVRQLFLALVFPDQRPGWGVVDRD